MKIRSKNTLKLNSDEHDNMQITIGSFRPFLNYKFKAGQKMWLTHACNFRACKEKTKIENWDR